MSANVGEKFSFFGEKAKISSLKGAMRRNLEDGETKRILFAFYRTGKGGKSRRDRRFFIVIIFDFFSDASAGSGYLSASRQILTFFRRLFRFNPNKRSPNAKTARRGERVRGGYGRRKEPRTDGKEVEEVEEKKTRWEGGDNRKVFERRGE